MFDVGDETTRVEAPAGVQLAPLSRRVVGLLIDQVIVLVPVFAIAVMAGYQPGDSVTDRALLVFNIAATVIAFCYETVMIALLGRTVGKLAAGTRVVRLVDGEPVGWSGAALRSLVPVASGVVPQVGLALGALVYGLAFFTPLRQGLHDKAAGTIVVRVIR